MGGVTGLLADARAAGLEIRGDGERLVVRGPRAAELLAQRLLACKLEVLAVLAKDDAEVAWRVAAMRPQVPASGPIPFLMARSRTPLRGECASCGDLLTAHRTLRCAPCTRAAWLVLHEVREGVIHP